MRLEFDRKMNAAVTFPDIIRSMADRSDVDKQDIKSTISSVLFSKGLELYKPCPRAEAHDQCFFAKVYNLLSCAILI
jgi:hypothetical protein